jgi:formamidopyrimidine-DNA glycosylase
MPELPEVETVVRQIRSGLEGRTITAARVGWARTVGQRRKGDFERRLIGRRIERVWRRAKYLVFDLSRGGQPAGALVGHLRMTGRMLLAPWAAPTQAFERVALALSDGQSLRFLDVRKFGRLVYVDSADDVLGELGPEPLEPAALSSAEFATRLRARRRQLKPLLLDQTFLAGLGNIYVDESLHRAGLHPLLSSARVAPAQAERLLDELRATLREAIEREGSSFDVFYRTPEGQPGSYQHQFLVYGRTGQPCRACGTPIERMVVGQRGTHYCPRCQSRRPGARQRLDNAGQTPAVPAPRRRGKRSV